MPTLNAMFKSMDEYSSKLNKLLNRSESAAAKISEAEGAAKQLKGSTDEAGDSWSRLSKGMENLENAAKVVKMISAGMGEVDAYVNIAADLNRVNDGLQTQAELQDKIFAAANRSGSSYKDLASAVTQLNQSAGDTFGSNDEAIQFTELLQKSLKLSGGGNEEQEAAFFQITEGMSAGTLQGDSFQTILEDAPMVAQAISNYMGVAKEELQGLASQGAITSDTIKNALFAASGEINGQFAAMPVTFADVWTKIKNAGQRAFGEIFLKINEILNSDTVQGALNNLIGLMYLLGDVMHKVLDLFMTAWPVITPFIWASVAALAAYALVLGLTNGLQLVSSIRTGMQIAAVGLQALAMWILQQKTWEQVCAELALNSAIYACPIVWLVGVILVLIALFYAAVAAINQFAGTSYSATGAIAGAVAVAAAFIWNIIAGVFNAMISIGVEIYNLIGSFVNFFANVFNDPVGAIIKLFADLFDFILGIVQSAAKLIDTVLGTNLAGAVEGFRDNVSAKVDSIVGEQVVVMEKKSASDYHLGRLEYGEAFDKGYQTGEGFENKVSGLFAGFADGNGFDEYGFDGNQIDEFAGDQLGTDNNPATVEGTGNGGEVEVNMAEEDIQYLRDLAQRDYIARIANNTLSPNIRVEFTGQITRDVDLSALGNKVGAILRNELDRTPEGVY